MKGGTKVYRNFIYIGLLAICLEPPDWLTNHDSLISTFPKMKMMVSAQLRTSYAEECPASWPETFPDCANKPVTSLDEGLPDPPQLFIEKSAGPNTKVLGGNSTILDEKTRKPNDIKFYVDTSRHSIQSPIDIRASESIEAREGTTEKALFFRNYDLTSQDWRLEKTKATVMLKTDSILPFIEIPEAYEFRQAHFHWGPGGGSLVGSEHSLDGRFYALEAHLVHESKASPNTFAVIAVLFDVPAPSTEYNFRSVTNGRGSREFYKKIWNEGYNARIEPIVEALKSEQEDPLPPAPSEGYANAEADHLSFIKTGGKPIIYMGDTKGFTLHSLLPGGWDGSFYRYAGSLTTPPCSPTVTWFVISKVATISRSQLDVFTRLKQCEHPALLGSRSASSMSSSKLNKEKDTRGQCYPDLFIGPNRRPIQAPNYRPIYHVTPSSSSIIPVKLRKPLVDVSAMLAVTVAFMKFLQILE